MKNLLFIVLGVILITAFSSPPEGKGSAEVQKLRGRYIFLYAEPSTEYEIVGEVSIATENFFLTADKKVAGRIDDLLNKAINQEKKGKVQPFDGIISNDLERATLVKFKE